MLLGIPAGPGCCSKVMLGLSSVPRMTQGRPKDELMLYLSGLAKKDKTGKKVKIG